MMPLFRSIKIGELGKVVTGKTPTSIRPELFGAIYPFLTPTDIDGHARYVQPSRFLSEAGRISQPRLLLPRNAVCVVCIGATIGKTCIARVPSFTNQQINAVVVNEAVHDPFFIYHVLTTLRDDLRLMAGGAATPIINKSAFSDIEINVPTLPIQRRIAGILSAYDDLIENSQRRIKILEEMARRLYREWFVYFRFPGHEGCRLVQSPLGEIPVGWEVKLVEEIVKRIPVGKKYDQKTVASNGAVPVFDQGKTGIIGFHDDEPGVVASETAPVIVFANHTCYQRLIHIPFSAIQNVLPFVPSPVLSRNIYWLHWATNGLVVFNDYKGHWPEFAAKDLIVPPAAFCQRFGEFAAPLSQQILKLERQIHNLRRTRDLLLPRLLSGQIDVESLSEPVLAES
jgi:type I restriction enzyme S subunit